MKSPLLLIFALGAVSISGCNHQGSNSKPGALQGNISENRGAGTSANIDPEKRVEAFARFATAVSYELTDQSELALEQFYQAALADPSNEPLVIELAKRYSQTKDFDKAIEVLSKAAKQPQASGNIFSSLARVYLASGKTNLAVNASQSAIQKSPGLISGYQTLTEIFLKNGQTDEALKILNQASRPTNSDSLYLINLGELFGKVARTQLNGIEAAKRKSLEMLHRAADQKPTNPNTRHRLADAFAQMGEWKDAAELYLGLLSEYSDVPLMRDGLREKLTNLYLKNSDKSKATEQLEAVVRDSPTRYPEAWYYLGNFAYEAKNYAKASEYFERALVINPEFEPAYYDLAGMQVSIDQAGEALKTLERARKKFPNSFTVEFFSGLAYARLKNFPEAIKHFTTAEVIGSATEPQRLTHLFYFQVGSTHERNHDYAEAESYFEKCLQISPD
ncbi:MAG: tetratricopeptide repeat protein, partial [Verrucomicrobiota bacterium]